MTSSYGAAFLQHELPYLLCRILSQFTCNNYLSLYTTSGSGFDLSILLLTILMYCTLINRTHEIFSYIYNRGIILQLELICTKTLNQQRGAKNCVQPPSTSYICNHYVLSCALCNPLQSVSNRV